MGRRPKLPTLDEIAAWLESETPPTKDEAEDLFETVIPAALDVEVNRLHKRSKALLRTAGELAGLTTETIRKREAWLTDEPLLPQSCAECSDAKPVYAYGAYKLLCQYEVEDPDALASRSPLAEVPAEEAFSQPAEISRGRLKEMVAEQDIPPWCPRHSAA